MNRSSVLKSAIDMLVKTKFIYSKEDDFVYLDKDKFYGLIGKMDILCLARDMPDGICIWKLRHSEKIIGIDVKVCKENEYPGNTLYFIHKEIFKNK